MKTELDKCMAGEWYDCHDPIFITQKGETRQLLARYNAPVSYTHLTLPTT